MEETQIEHILVKSWGGNILSEALCLRMTRESKWILLFVQKKQKKSDTLIKIFFRCATCDQIYNLWRFSHTDALRGKLDHQKSGRGLQTHLLKLEEGPQLRPR